MLLDYDVCKEIFEGKNFLFDKIIRLSDQEDHNGVSCRFLSENANNSTYFILMILIMKLNGLFFLMK